MENVFVRYERCEVQPAPTVKTKMAEQTQNTIGLVLSVRPQLGDATGKFKIGQRILRPFHAGMLSRFSGRGKDFKLNPYPPPPQFIYS